MKCPYCGSDQIITYYEAKMPNILAACSKQTLKTVNVFSLKASLCKSCLLGFNSSKLNENELKQIYDNYIYISPLQGIGLSKYQGMLSTLKKYYNSGDKLVEIGCSEGYLLNQLQMAGYSHLLGIEPGPQAEQAIRLGLTVIKEYYNEDTFFDMDIDGFYLMHVFEHFSDPFSILDAMIKHLTSTGKIIIEVPDFGGYHHQHLFFYNLPFLNRLCKDKGLTIIETTNAMNALRIVAIHEDESKSAAIPENENQFNILKRAKQIQMSFFNQSNRLNNLFEKNKGRTIYWWGAGSLSVIFLNQVSHELIKQVNLVLVDGDQNKWGNFIPGVGIEVQSYHAIKNNRVDVMVIASSFYNEIKTKMDYLGIKAEHIEVLQ